MEATLTEQLDKSYIWRSIDIEKVRGRIDEISEKLNKVLPDICSNNIIYKEQKSEQIPFLIVIVSPNL